MQDDNIVSINQIEEFLKLNDAIAKFSATNKKERNLWIENVLAKFKYFSCRKKEKIIMPTIAISNQSAFLFIF